MASLYSETPDNITDLNSILITSSADIERLLQESSSCFFYDSCSIQFHSSLTQNVQEYFSTYIRSKEGIIIITKCILMELGGLSHIIEQNVIDYFTFLHSQGIQLILFDEKDIFSILLNVYATAKVMEFFKYAVRCFNKNGSTIKITINNFPELTTVISDKEKASLSLCSRFFSEVKNTKAEGDNLGEELIGICIYMLLHLIGEPTEKFSFISDDKGAISKIYCALSSIPSHVTNKRAILLSTPRLVQHMVNEKIISSAVDIEKILLSCGIQNTKVLAIKKNDLRPDEYSHTVQEWASLILQPDEVRIIV